MIFDGASSDKAKDLPVPENIRLIPLPAGVRARTRSLNLIAH